MPRKIIDIGSRLQSAFGYVTSNVSPTLTKAGFNDEIRTAEVFILNGNTTFEELVLTGNSTKLKFGYTDLIKGIGDVFAPPPMVTFTKAKRIEITHQDGVDGDVVERYGHKAWEVTLEGLLIDMDNHQYPSEKVQQLNNLFDYDGIWDVESQIFSDHKIRSVFFESIDSAGVQGFPDTWTYTLKGYGIKPVEWFLKYK